MNVCPKDAITMTEQGVYGCIYPSIDASKCIDCGLCVNTCPVNNPVEKNEPLKAFAAISKDTKDLMSSSSGAASSVIANHILAGGGVVYGCVQENYCDIAHRRIDNLDEVHKIKGSKYVHSNIGLTFREVKKDLKERKKVLFTGTPCQIAGLRNYLKKEYENLFLVDLVCHGVPPQKLLREDIEKTIDKHHLNKDGLKVLFRRKIGGKAKLGMEYGLFLYDKKGDEIALPREDVAFLHNRYITAFMSGIIFRENCFSCPYAQPKRCSDVTIADFWGIKNTKIPTDNGVSLLLANTGKGEELIRTTSNNFRIEEHSVQEAVAGNGQLKVALKRPKERNRFIHQYAIDSEEALNQHIKEYNNAYKRKQFKIKLYLALTNCKPVYKLLRRIKYLIKR